MVKRLVTFAVHQPLFLVLLVILFIAGGVTAFRLLPVEAFPDVSDVQVTVITLFPGHAPEEVEKQITIPMEIALSGVPHAVRMFTHTQFGLSYLTLTFDDDVDDYFARQRVQERFQDVDLPPNVVPELAPLSTPVGELYRFQLVGRDQSPMELRSIEDWVVERAVRTVPGVADVVTMGGFVKQYEVRLDPPRLKAYGVTLQQVLTALSRGNANAGGSYIEIGEQQYLVRGLGLLQAPQDIGSVIVAGRKGTPIRIRELAEVAVGSAPRQGLVARDDQPEIVNGIVLMRKGENPSLVLAALKEKVAQLNRSMLPPGVRIDPYYDRTWLISTTLRTVFRNLLTGALLVVAVLYLFLRRFRAAAVVAAIIPLALLATFIGLRLRGIPANLLSLGAMDFGIIVDGAVIVVENIFRRLGEERPVTAGDRKSVILTAAEQVGRPTLFSMLIIIVAHLPIFALQRQEGRIFAPMAYTVVSALIGSLLFSLTLVPLLSVWLLRGDMPSEDTRLMARCRALYEPCLEAALRRPWLVVGSAATALVLTAILALHLGTEFLPELNEGSIWVNANMPSSISFTDAAAVNRRLIDALRAMPEVRSVVSKIGRPEDGTDPKPISMAEAYVDVKPQNEWRNGLTRERMLDEMERRLGTIPGLDVSLSQPIRDNVLESISQIDGQVVVKIFGDDAQELHEAADRVLQAIQGVAGVDRAFVDRAGDIPQLRIAIDRERAARYGLNVADVEDVIETALGGTVTTQLWEGERHFGVAVRLKPRDREDVAVIRKLLVSTADDQQVPLEQVADIGIASGAMNISREDGRRVVAVGVFIRGRDMGSVVRDMQAAVARSVHFPTGYYVTWGGEFENQQRAMARLAVIVPVSLLLIFMLLFHTFGSMRTAVIVLGNIPLAAMGGVIALFLAGIPLSVSAAIGFIALFGQAVLNGVVMVSDFTARRGAGAPLRDAVVAGAIGRLRTVLMTALLAMLGLLPMAISHEIGAEVQRPLAVVIIGGLFSATLLTLFVLPVLYEWVEDRMS